VQQYDLQKHYKMLHFPNTVHVFVLYDSHIKQGSVPCTVLTSIWHS